MRNKEHGRTEQNIFQEKRLRPKDSARGACTTDREMGIPLENETRKIDNNNIYRKSMDWLNHREKQRGNQRQVQHDREMAVCSFNPNI